MADLFLVFRYVPLAIRRCTLKNRLSLIGIFIFILIVGCQQETKPDSDLEIISVDLSQSRIGKLSEFFEPNIEYIWLEDDSEEAQLTAGLQEILFHQDRIYTLDIFGCKCIHIFDKSGTYLSKIKSYGEGPGQYLDYDAVAFVDGELVLLGVYPRKIMWFTLAGEYLREVSFREPVGPGVFSEFDDRYYLYTPTREPEAYFVKSLDISLKDTLAYFPYDPEKLYGHFSGRNFFQKSHKNLYFGMTYLDTIYQIENGKFNPKLVFDFGKYAQDPEEIKSLEDTDEELDFINYKAKLYFRSQYLISERQFYTKLVYERKGINVFFDRERQKTHVINVGIIDDIDGGYDPYQIIYSFELGKVGLKVPGRDLYEILMEKKESLSQSDYENWINTNGKNFAAIANKARESENPVLIVYTMKH